MNSHYLLILLIFSLCSFNPYYEDKMIIMKYYCKKYKHDYETKWQWYIDDQESYDNNEIEPETVYCDYLIKKRKIK